MIKMSVSDENLLERQTMPLDGCQNTIEVTARIDHRRTPRVLTPYDAAVLLKRSNRNNFDLHTVMASPR
jgi:hypothetical protein